MKKSKIYLWIGIALIVLAFILDSALSPRLNDGKDLPDWPMEMWIFAAVDAVILVAGIVLIVYGAKLSKKEKQLQGNANSNMCKSCGSKLPENAKFCNNCGTKATTDQE